jgi:4-alpha-glucanotransferase
LRAVLFGILYIMVEHKIIGTLAPIFSLSSSQISSEDQGTFETGLFFLDWLKKTKQSAWQILPINETQLEIGSATKHVPSPYKGYGIGLAPRYLSSRYATMQPSLEQKNKFIAEHKEWLEDYALFCSIRDVYGTDDWRTWAVPLRKREKEPMKEWAKKYKVAVDYYIILQWQLHQAYKELHDKAKEYDIELIGDFPYYLSVHSPLVWANQKAFMINKDGSLPFVSGIPNTATTHFGRQVWGHPLYNWDNDEAVMKLWKLRLHYQASLFERVRFDHAKAFFAYGVMEPDHEENDRYADGPGVAVFQKVLSFAHEQELEIFAEDSGDKTGDLRKCLNDLRIPGIKIYRFAMKQIDGIINEKYAAIQHYPENCVAYTTTHDTMTLFGYIQAITSEQKQQLAAIANIQYNPDDKILTKSIINAMIKSPAHTVIIPIQDWLLSIERINLPGTEKEVGDTNWQYKIDKYIEDLPETL